MRRPEATPARVLALQVTCLRNAEECCHDAGGRAGYRVQRHSLEAQLAQMTGGQGVLVTPQSEEADRA